MLNSYNQWENSLRLEQEYWKSKVFLDSLPKKLQRRKREAEQFKQLLERFESTSMEEIKILQIGSAAIGLINDLPCGKLYAIDPLKDFYEEKFPQLLNEKVNFLSAVGENIPFKDKEFDWVICCKTLCHVSSVDVVLKEVSRVLKDNGKAFITIPIYQCIPSYILKITSKFNRKNIKDFNYFNQRNFIRQIKNFGFSILYFDNKSFRQKRKENKVNEKKWTSIFFPEVTLKVILKK